MSTFFSIPPLLTCEQVRQQFDGLLQNTLDSETSGRIEGHLGGCHNCAVAFSEAVRIAQQRGAIPRPEIPPLQGGLFSRRWRSPSASSTRSWPQRIQQALETLAIQAGQTRGAMASQLQQLTQQAAVQAEAAVEVVLDESRKIGEILTDSLANCVNPYAGFRFQYARGISRDRSGNGDTKRSTDGLFFTFHISGARILVNVQKHTVTVKFAQSHPALLIVLVPHDPTRAPIPKYAEASQSIIVFENVPAGNYALVIYTMENGSAEKPSDLPPSS